MINNDCPDPNHNTHLVRHSRTRVVLPLAPCISDVHLVGRRIAQLAWKCVANPARADACDPFENVGPVRKGPRVTGFAAHGRRRRTVAPSSEKCPERWQELA